MQQQHQHPRNKRVLRQWWRRWPKSLTTFHNINFLILFIHIYLVIVAVVFAAHPIDDSNFQIPFNNNNKNDDDSSSSAMSSTAAGNQREKNKSNFPVNNGAGNVSFISMEFYDNNYLPTSAINHQRHHHHHRHYTFHDDDDNRKRRQRHRRRLPLGPIVRLVAKLTGGGAGAKVAPVSAKIAKNGADKVDDIMMIGRPKLSPKLGRNGAAHRPMASGSGARNAPSQRDSFRPIDPPSFGNALPRDEIRQKALTGANLALATGAVVGGVWYFSSDNASLYIGILIAVVLFCAVTIVITFAYCVFCRSKKRGYYAVNDADADDAIIAFVKKLFFYLL